MRRWLGRDSGWAGLVLATIGGAATPGGPFAAFPLVVAFRRAGADLGAAVTYVTAWSLLGLQRFAVYELPLMGPDFAWLRLAIAAPLPLVVGAAVRLAFRARSVEPC